MVYIRKEVEVVAFPAIRAAAAGEEKATVLDPGGAGTSETLVFLHIAACLGLDFAV